ncbi:hypothetical protein PDE_06953 [Penicillium oxalicum 114-2]|uniref:Uncharacterized protein n=1 Tax=Penicillium oxalicum (strain 114-2 / CGMCC 5302) TaxID=933388 RepID=S7ZNP8_PENO1|nr:hypothetical protein PDE_06953 [Penicillium oxalicum 114-2]
MSGQEEHSHQEKVDLNENGRQGNVEERVWGCERQQWAQGEWNFGQPLVEVLGTLALSLETKHSHTRSGTERGDRNVSQSFLGLRWAWRRVGASMGNNLRKLAGL